jgi:multicomponent Na+:H+ antiporter subunit A
MLALAVGAGLIVAQAGVGRLQERVAFGPSAGDVFRRLVMALLQLARRVVAVAQSGSLPIYLAVILLTFVVVPGVVLLPVVDIPEGAVFAESALQTAAALALVVAAVGVTVVERRFAAALLLGAVGYAMAVLFVAYDAPDLALTQFLVETIIVVAFVLVLRRLPEEFAPVHWPGRQALRIVTSVGVAALVFAFLLVAGSEDGPPPPTDDLVEVAYAEGGGKNVVNVILTDIRALDTMGEIAVVAVAALGVMSLTVLAPRPRRRLRANASPAPDPTRARSSVLALTVRTITPLAFLFSLFMLLSGHNAPGGGFIGGLVVSAALVLRFVNDPDEVPYWWERPGPLLGGGLALAVTVAMAGWVNGSPFFDMRVAEWDLGPIGPVKLTSALPFDVGVYALVMGMTVAILHSLGGAGPSTGDPVESTAAGDDRGAAGEPLEVAR